MTAIPLLSGVGGTETGEFVQTYPLNLEPVIVDSKISKGQLRAADGAVQTGVGPGGDRGGVVWNGLLYRVMGTRLVSISADWTVNNLGDVGTGARAWLDYSFDRLAIGSNSGLYYYTVDAGLSQVTDTDLGAVIDGIWIDGYFMTTDGTYVVVTELSDPTQVKPLKYGSAEEDPDAITGLLKFRDEAYVLGRYTIQPFKNIGGNGFPFSTDLGVTIPFGCVSTTAKCRFGDGFAFVGSSRNEGLDVYIGGIEGTAQPIGCRELCDELDALQSPGVVELESRNSRGERHLLVHLPSQTWVFLLKASARAGEPVWHRLRTDETGYRCRNAIKAYGRTIVADPFSGAFGYLTADNRDHFGVEPDWEFEAGLLYNQGLGAILDSVELVGLPGRGNGAVFMSTTRDGETWSGERSVIVGAGDHRRRIAWRPHKRIGNYLGLRFRGVGPGLPGIASLEAKLRPLTS